jgi:hypothetical protein
MVHLAIDEVFGGAPGPARRTVFGRHEASAALGGERGVAVKTWSGARESRGLHSGQQQLHFHSGLGTLRFLVFDLAHRRQIVGVSVEVIKIH